MAKILLLAGREPTRNKACPIRNPTPANIPGAVESADASDYATTRQFAAADLDETRTYVFLSMGEGGNHAR